jgi:hypothetical protein
MEIDETVFKIIIGIALIIAIFLDWPRALAGALVGFVGRRLKQPWWMVLVGVVLVAALGEFIYAAIGRTSGMSWGTFNYGVLIAGACALGLMRFVGYMFDN